MELQVESKNIRRMTFPRTVTVGLIAGLMVAFVVATSHAQRSASSADEQTERASSSEHGRTKVLHRALG